MSLIVVGSANMDLVVRVDRFPAPGETLMGNSFATFPGGKGANQAVAAGRLGGDVKFVGCVGDDSFGESLRASLAEAGIDTRGLLAHHELPTGIASITVDDKGQNAIVVAPGANSAVTADQALAATSLEDVLLAQLEIPVDEVCKLLRSSRARTKILNPAPAAELPTDIFSCIDLITPNETEAETLTGIRVESIGGAHQCAQALLQKGIKEVVITLGERGCFYAAFGVTSHFPAWPVKPVDTTAAGDAFSGALALFVSQGKKTIGAIRLASMAAALSTTKHGAQASMPTLEELRALEA